jgi:uncharacterized protein (DUF697 family)
MKLPVDIRDLMRSGEALRNDREQELRVAVFVDVEAPDALVEDVREALRPLTGAARLHVEACAPGETLLIDPAADAVVALAGPHATLERSLASSREQFVPTVLVTIGEMAGEASRRLNHPLLDTVSAETPEQAVHALGAWLADRLNGKRLALAHNFAFLRRAVAEEAVKNTAFQNGVIGFVAVIPGADLPLMTANQGKMLLQIAAAYGQPLGPERIKELAVIVGSGFALRALARQLLTLVPGFGWALKAAIGYSGTLAMGYAAVEYFQDGGDFHGLAARVREARDSAIENARARISRGEPAEEPLPAHAYVVASGPDALSAADTGAAGPPVAVVDPATLPRPEALPAAPATPPSPEGAGAQ